MSRNFNRPHVPSIEELDKLKSKVKKLFNLGESTNEYESALALKRAHEIIDRYNLDIVDILKMNSKDIEGDTVDVTSGYKRLIVWYNDLARLIAYMFNVRWYYTTGHRFVHEGKDCGSNLKITFYGVSLNAEIAAYAFISIRNQIWELLEKIEIDYLEYEDAELIYSEELEKHMNWRDLDSIEDLPNYLRNKIRKDCMRWSTRKSFKTDYKKSYCQGIISTIYREILDQRKVERKNQDETSTALVVCYNAVARRVLEEKGIKLTNSKNTKTNGRSSVGFTHGVKDRSKVTVTQGLNK